MLLGPLGVLRADTAGGPDRLGRFWQLKSLKHISPSCAAEAMATRSLGCGTSNHGTEAGN